MERTVAKDVRKTDIPDHVFAQVSGVGVCPIQGPLGDEYALLCLELAKLDGEYHPEISRLLLPKELVLSLRDEIQHYLDPLPEVGQGNPEQK